MKAATATATRNHSMIDSMSVLGLSVVATATVVEAFFVGTTVLSCSAAVLVDGVERSSPKVREAEEIREVEARDVVASAVSTGGEVAFAVERLVVAAAVETLPVVGVEPVEATSV